MVSIKVGEMLSATILIALIFAVIYKMVSNVTFGNALYKSLSIQTLGGDKIAPKTATEKVVTTTQHLIAFMMLSGLVIISLKTV